MKGSSSATRRFRSSPLQQQLFATATLPIRVDDDDEDRLKKKRRYRRLGSALLSREAVKIVQSLLLESAWSRPVFYVGTLVLVVLSLGSRRLIMGHGPATASVLSIVGGRRRLETFISVLPRRLNSYGRTAVVCPRPLTRVAREQRGNRRHFGGLAIGLFDPNGCPQQGCTRQIYHDFTLDETKMDREDPDEGTYDNYYAFDDDRIRNPYVRYSRKMEDLEKRCRRVSWHRLNPINCNIVHELDFRSVTERGDTRFIGAGAYRQVYLTNTGAESFILKTFGENSKFDMADFEYMRMDSIVAERLSSREQIVDIYSFCGLTNLNEPMMNGDLESLAEPHGVRAPHVHLHDEKHLDPQNNFLPSEKLRYSLEMVEAVALLHSYPGGVIVHDDIQMSQFLLTSDNHLRLNDFNRAEMMTFNEDENEYCRYTNNPGHGDWRSPEEYMDHPLNEKIDVYSLGNSMYAVLTGVGVFYDESDIENLQKRVMAGEQPHIDPRWRERSFAERKMIEIMEKMWTYDPDERVDIFEVVAFLREALDETRRNYMHEDEALSHDRITRV